MADQIPDKIHFIWVGGTIPVRQGSTVLSWALRNPAYKTQLWTNKPEENAVAIERIAGSFPSLVDDPSVLTAPWKKGEARVVMMSRQLKKPVEVHCRHHAKLHSQMGLKLTARFFSELANRNFGGASDILRIAALQEEGGIYLDTDSDAMDSLPGNLTAEDGVLFGVLDQRGFCNAVIAAPAGHPYLLEIAEAMTADYEYWERKGLLSKYRRGVEEARAGLVAAKVGGNERVIKAAKTRLQQNISSGTLLITGPTRVAIWLYLHTGGSYTPGAWARDRLGEEFRADNHLKQAELLSNFQNMVVGPHIKEPNILRAYGFPSKYVRINSEASWVK